MADVVAAGHEGRGLARNTLLNLGGQLVPLLLAVVAIPPIVRGLGDDRFGILSLAWILLGYFGLFDLGMGRAATKFVAEALGRDDVAAVPALAWTAAAVQAGFGMAGGIVLAALAPTLATRIFEIPASLAAEATLSFTLLAASVPVVLVSGSFRGVLEAAQRFDLINAVRVPSSAASYLLPLAGLALGARLPGVMALLVAGRVLSGAAFILLCLRVFPSMRRVEVRTAALRRLLGFGGWVTASAVTIPLLSSIERLLLGSLLSVGTLTYYATPFEMVTRAAILPASLAVTLFPAFSYRQARGGAGVGDLVARPLKYLLLAMAPFLALFAAFAPEILAAWLGGEFAVRSAGVLRILAAAFTLNALAHVPFAAVQGLGRPDLKTKLDLVEVPLFVGFCWLLIPGHGIVGAALAKLAITVVDTAGLFWFTARLGALPRAAGSGGLAVATSLGGALVAGVFLLRAIPGSPPALDAALALALSAAFAAAGWRLALDGTDRALVRGLAPRLLRGRVAGT